MSTIKPPHLPRETVRVEVLRLITCVVTVGRDVEAVASSGVSYLDIGRAIGISEKMAEESAELYKKFVKIFGTKPLDQMGGNVVFPPAVLAEFLSKPAVIQLASDILGMPGASIIAILKKT